MPDALASGLPLRCSLGIRTPLSRFFSLQRER